MNLQVTKDQRDNFREIAAISVCAGMGLCLSQEETGKLRASNYGTMGLQGLARSCLDLQGVNTLRMNPIDVACALLDGERAVTADYANVLANVANKAVAIILEAAPPSYMKWTKTVPLKDFRAAKLTGLLPFSLQTVVTEGTAPNTATRPDAGESATLKKLHDTYILSFEAITNDDTNAFLDTMRAFALAGPNSVNKAVYRYLMANGNISDGKALFHADHGNLKANGEPFSILGCDAAVQAMMLQVVNGQNFNMLPKYVIVPVTMWATANQLLSSMSTQILSGQHEVPQNNPFAQKGIAPLEAITDACLADATAPGYDANQWFASADAVAGGICVGTLDGANTPIITSRVSLAGEAAGVIFDSKFFYDVAAGNYRALYKNDGGV